MAYQEAPPQPLDAFATIAEVAVTLAARESAIADRKKIPDMGVFLFVFIVRREKTTKNGKKVPIDITERYIKKYCMMSIAALQHEIHATKC